MPRWVGFIGNEAVAWWRIRVGRQIGSAALVADGLHARTDGLTSLAVLLGAGGVAVGWGWADPVVGLVITAAIGLVLASAVKEVFARLLDAVDPALVTRAEQILAATPGVLSVDSLRMRWVGHSLRVEAEVGIDPAVPLSQAHGVVHDAEHALLHAIDRLAAAIIHANPAGQHDTHDGLRHHDVQGGLARP